MKRFVSAALVTSTHCSIMCPHVVFEAENERSTMLFAARDLPAENEPFRAIPICMSASTRPIQRQCRLRVEHPMQWAADRAPVTGKEPDLLPGRVDCELVGGLQWPSILHHHGSPSVSQRTRYLFTPIRSTNPRGIREWRDLRASSQLLAAEHMSLLNKQVLHCHRRTRILATQLTLPLQLMQD